MYSRYIPRPGGGYDRRLVPESQDARQAAGSSQQETGAGGRGSPGPHPRYEPPPPRHAPPPRPPVRPPGPINGPPLGGLGGLLGPDGLLGRLLPRALDTEDLLILAVLLLAMKQDGANPMELLIAAGLYLWL